MAIFVFVFTGFRFVASRNRGNVSDWRQRGNLRDECEGKSVWEMSAAASESSDRTWNRQSAAVALSDSESALSSYAPRQSVGGRGVRDEKMDKSGIRE